MSHTSPNRRMTSLDEGASDVVMVTKPTRRQDTETRVRVVLQAVAHGRRNVSPAGEQAAFSRRCRAREDPLEKRIRDRTVAHDRRPHAHAGWTERLAVFC